jgi:hypothetical protein
LLKIMGEGRMRENKIVYSFSFGLPRYSIMFRMIEARSAGILSKTSSNVCVSLCGSVAKNY